MSDFWIAVILSVAVTALVSVLGVVWYQERKESAAFEARMKEIRKQFKI